MDVKRKVIIVDLSDDGMYNQLSMDYVNEMLNEKYRSILEENYKESCKCKGKHEQPKQTFQQAAEPLMKYLAENHHPHCTAIVSSAYAELMEGIESHSTDEFLND